MLPYLLVVLAVLALVAWCVRVGALRRLALERREADGLLAERDHLNAEIKVAKARIEACQNECNAASIEEVEAGVEREMADGNWHRARRQMISAFQRQAPDLERAAWLLLRHDRQAMPHDADVPRLVAMQRYALLGLGATAANPVGANPDRWLAALREVELGADGAAEGLIPVPEFLLRGGREHV